MAWRLKRYALDGRGTYAEAEVAAQAARVGLWQDVPLVAPWEWQHKKLELVAAAGTSLTDGCQD